MDVNTKIEEVQKLGSEVKEALEQIETCDLNNTIHAAKIARLGEVHKQKAQGYLATVKGEVAKVTRERNTCCKYGDKHLSAAISEQKGKPMTNICRDRDTSDGGRKGQITSNPADVDDTVRRAWSSIHKGAGDCIDIAVDHFLDLYCSTIYKRKPFEADDITAEMVQESFS